MATVVTPDPSKAAVIQTRNRWGRAIGAVALTAALASILFVWNPSGLYPWFKAFHVIAIIAWMAGMLYLPRLFVYHCEAEIGSRQSETFKVMERRLLRAIINPAMVLSWVFGLWLAYAGVWTSAHWLQAKVALVIGLSGLHGMLARWTVDFAVDRNRHTQRFYRIINEVPTILMIGIVILVVVKPF
jgi:protoporphyrinogen IX oxidase